MDKNGYSVTGFGTSSVEFKSTHLDVLKIDRCDGVLSGKERLEIQKYLYKLWLLYSSHWI